MKSIRRIISSILCVVLILTAAPLSGFVGLELPAFSDLFSTKAEAQSYSGTCGDNLTWSLNNDTGELIISGTGEMYDYTPQAVPWYGYNQKISSVKIRDGVTVLGSYAFYLCENLTNITIPNSVTSINREAFYGCTNLTGIIIPASVKKIDSGVFSNCSSLAAITVDEGNLSYSSDEYGVLFNKSKTEIIQYPIGNARTSYTIPNSVTIIGESAFECCDSLTNITILDGVISIENAAFSHCDSLADITIPNGMISIGSYAFNSCDSLTSIIIPDSVVSIDRTAFSYCLNITRFTVTEGNGLYSSDEYGVLFNKDKTELVQYPKGNTKNEYKIPDSVIYICDSAFEDCNNLTSIIIPDSVTSIGSYAFYYCLSLANVSIPDSVTSIGSYAFYNTIYYNDSLNWVDNILYIGDYLIKAETSLCGTYTIKEGTKCIADSAFEYCESLTNIIIPDSVTSIGDHAFSNCYSLTSVTIPDSVTSIGYCAFRFCSSLSNISIPDSVTSISDSAFEYCEGLTSITISDSVISIGSEAFRFCSSLSNISIPDSVTSISDSVFEYCENLTSVIIPDGVISIGTDAFYCCTNLKSITIPESVTSVDKGAFAFCTAIADVEIKDANVVLENNAFYNCSNLTNLSFGSGEVSIGDYAFAECTSLVNVYLPESIKMINECAFGGCVSLEKITIPKSITVIPDFLFYNCTNLNTIVLQNNIKRIENSAFYNCVNLSNAYFCGSQEEWEKVSVYPGNEDLLNNIKYDYVITSGVCGDDLVWKLNLETGSLVISGNGKMYDYSSESGFMHPWNAEFVKSVSFSGNVTGIGSYAFYKCVNLMEIIIPDSVNVIGVSAFDYCASLKSVTIGNGVDYIEDIFYGCERLSTVNIGSGVTGFDSDLFSDCCFLEHITVNSKNNYYSNDDNGVLFNKDKTELIQYPKGNKRTSYIIPETVRVIGDSAFSNSDNLTSIEIPNSVTDVGEEALAACDRLTSVIIGTGVTHISDYVFYNCPNLENISIGNGVKEIGEEAFYYCTNLESVDIPDSVTVIGARAFMDCHSLKSVSVGNSVEVIEAGAFANCNSLKNVSLGNSVEIIGNGAFIGCSSLTDIVIPESVTMIKDAAFCGCQNLSNISIPQTDILIGEEAFIYTEYYGDPLEWPKDEMGMQLYIGNHLIKVYIGKRDFVVNEGTRTIASGTFRETGFVSVSTPDSVTLIGDGAFAEMYNLTTVKLGNGIKRIGSSVFKDSTNLTEVYMGKEAEGFSVAEDALDGFTGRIYGYADSYMQTFAESRGIEFVAYDIVALNYNGFGDGVDHLRAAGGKILSDIPNVFSESKTFTGWYDTPDGGTLYTSESVVNEDITLYANWTDRKIQKQTVITPPAKTSYFVGDEFVLDGYEVEIEYDNGFTKTYNKDNLTVLDSILTEAGEQTVSVQADEFVIEIPVEVIPIKASSISVSKLPVKTEYVTGQKIDTTGLELKVVNNNGTTEYVTDGFELVNDAVYSVGINEVQVIYEGLTTSFNVNVVAILPATLSVSKQPNKTFYSSDEEFDPKGIELTVTYNNGTAKVLSNLSTVSIEYDFSSMNPTVTFSYTERGKTLTCSLDVVLYECPEISLENVSVESGGTFGIPVYIKDNCGLRGFNIKIEYDANVFAPQSVTWAIETEGQQSDNIGDDTDGSVDFSWSGEENHTSNGLLFTVYFKASEIALGDYDFGISYSADNVFNEDEELIKLNCKGSTVSVLKPALPDVMTLYIDTVTAENGTQVDVPVKLHKNTGLGVSVINIVYDSNSITPVNVASGISTVLTENSSSANGNLQIVILATDASAGDGTLFTIKFEVDKKAAGVYPLELSCAGQTTQNGLIMINNASLSEPPRIYADDVIASPGETLRIPVYISNNHGIMGMGIHFSYDPYVLRPINVIEGSLLLGSGFFVSDSFIEENRIAICWNGDSNFFDDGEIVVLEFEVLTQSDVRTLIEVTYSQDDTCNEKWEDVILDCSNINVVVTSDLLAAKPGTTTVIESGLIYGLDCGLDSLDGYVIVDDSYNLDYNDNEVLGSGSVVSVMLDDKKVKDYNIVIFGDVNGDGWYDGMDAVIVSCLESGMLTKDDVGEAVYMAADCNHDGVIDQLDVDLLNQAGSLLANVDQSKSAEILLETSSEYVEYISLIDQSPEIEDEKTEGVPEVDVESEDTTPEQDYAEVNIFEMIINFIKSIFELLFAYIPVPIN